MPADRTVIEYEAWLRSNGVPSFVVRRGRLRRIAAFWSGLFSIIAFTLAWFAEALARRGGSALIVTPLLLIAVTLSFFSTETWQTVGSLHGLPLVLTILLFGALAALFVSRRSRPDLDALAEFTDAAALREAFPPRLTPPDPDTDPPTAPRLHARERANALAVSVLAQVVIAAVIGVVVAAFFVTLGILTVDAHVTESWIQHHPGILARWDVGGHEYTISRELLRVSAFLGTFAGFYFVVTSSSDHRLRSELDSGHEAHLRSCLAVRTEYRRRLRASVDR